MEIKREHHFNFWYLILAFMAILFIQDLLVEHFGTENIPYSQFQTLLAQGKVDDLVVGDNEITGTLKEPKNKNVTRFSTVRVPSDIADKLTAAHVSFTGKAPPGLLANILAWIIPAAIFFGVWMFLI